MFKNSTVSALRYPMMHCTMKVLFKLETRVVCSQAMVLFYRHFLLDQKEMSSDVSSAQLSPPAKRPHRQMTSEPSSSDTSPSPQTKGQRVSWDIPTYRTRSACHMGHRKEELGQGDHSRMNGHVELRKSQFEHLNQSLLFDQLVNSTAEAVLQEMDNISSIRQNREVERLRMWTRDTEEENMDMYSRVKRRKSMRRNTFSLPAHHKALSKTQEEEEEDDEGDEAEEAGEGNDRPYNLRQRKTVQRYEAPPIEPVNRKQSNPTLFDTHRSPARRSHIRIKKHAIHSSDTTSSSDEECFERRKSKSMTRARNRCLPMNLTAEDLASGVLRDRTKVGASLADVDPMNLDTSVRFDQVGGLGNHIQSLKEMVVFPLLYPEVFERFKIQPPRGCLFYGPPGTGKTLVARALANECSQGERKVSFFMRKGADCLSKWVGESERQLRLLFDQAYMMRPSIIFFDEIDGLAPVRSSRQDQIHSSIVSTLLALMDGLDSRGEIVVIGATNRLDSIDPALRRPGRFDREFLFNLPDRTARKHILQIHTRDWSPKLSEPFVDELAEKCVGYCGADIKALCTEAALVALRRRYPQIYGSSVKLKLDVASIVLGPTDFCRAMRAIVPASQRALAPPGRALSPVLRPLLAGAFSLVLTALRRVFPHAQCADRDMQEDAYSDDDDDDNATSIYEVQPAVCPISPSASSDPTMRRPLIHCSFSPHQQPTAYRPRLLLAGSPGSGQSSHLAPALLHHLDKLPVHRLDLPTLYSTTAKTPEESCAQVFREACRSVPSVVFVPHISEWWETVSDTLKSTFLSLLLDVPSFCPVLVLATAETLYSQLSEEVRTWQDLPDNNELHRISLERRVNAYLGIDQVLPVAEAPGPRVLSAEEQRRLAEQEENTLRELRLFLRDVTKRLATDKRFNIFSKPVDIEEVSDYLEVIGQPMDLSTVMTKIDKHQYLTAKDFLVDIDLICSNALEYNPDKDPGDKVIRHRACSLKDTAHAIFASELDPEFDRMCEDIKEARRKKGEKLEVFTFSFFVFTHFVSDHIKKKLRRRPSWVRGIIRKHKHHKKGADEHKVEEHTETEMEAAGPSDSCLTLDEESSCDTPGPRTNGHLPHVSSMEEESSNEPPVGSTEAGKELEEQTRLHCLGNDSHPQTDGDSQTDAKPPIEKSDCSDAQHTESLHIAQVNGNESMDSLDQCLEKNSKAGEERMPQNTAAEIASEEQHSSIDEGESNQEHSGKIVEEDQDKEGTNSDRELLQKLGISSKYFPLILQVLLNMAVRKSEGFSVEQLERLYSVLSQCIFAHRREYDKTRLLEEMEDRIQHFDTFL
uniref:ATPase family AAA domain-containing protein 2 n=1 Tax=Hippocampus comes TaxID=109280 RepID=A0A3Q2XF29_HIPCM